ncbi:MAG: efflux transporter periplasmic adaptor subunit, partial [Bauldia litoralis]
MIKRFIIAFVLLVLVVGGIVGFNMFRDQAISDFFANMKPPAVTVSTMTVEPISWTPGIDAIGTVSAAQGIDLTVETSGIVAFVSFTANEQVPKGKVLVQLDDAVQQADLTAAKIQADLDDQSLERALELQKRGVNTDVTVDSARAAASASKAQVAKLQAVL